MISKKKSVHIIIHAQTHKPSGLWVINQVIGCAAGIESGVFAVEDVLEDTIDEKLFAEEQSCRDIHRTIPPERFGAGVELIEIPINNGFAF